MIVHTIAESGLWHPEHQGWSTEILPFYTQMSERIPQGGTFVEVGVFLGRSLRYMAELRSDLDIWAVDPWLDYDVGIHQEYVNRYGSLFRAFLASMPAAVLDRIHIVRGTAATVSLNINADMVYIDGAHDYRSVQADIAEFHRNVNVGGIIAGHDYGPMWFEGVTRAVDEAFGSETQTAFECNWWVEC